MDPNIWGPHAWIFLHSISLQYPSEPSSIEKEKYKSFLHSLQYVLPCQKCRKHYQMHYKKNPPRLNSKKEFVEWVFDLHNIVNESNHKKRVGMDGFLDFYHKLFKREIHIRIPKIRPNFDSTPRSRHIDETISSPSVLKRIIHNLRHACAT